MDYQTKGKFLNLSMFANDLQIIRAQKYNKFLIELKNPKTSTPILCTKVEALGHLADFLDIPRNEFKNIIKNQEVMRINKALRQQPKDRIIQIHASCFNNTYWVFTFATESFEIIPFRKVRPIVEELIPEAEEIECKKGITWVHKYRTIEQNEEKFDLSLTVKSGTNTKESALSVVATFRVHSCNNSARCFQRATVRHYAEWESKLRANIEEALIFMESIEQTLEIGMATSMDLEEAYDYVDELTLPIKKEEKIEYVKNLIKQRLKFEFEKNPTRFGLSQALSYIGTHGDPKESTDYTLEVLQAQAFEVLTV